VSVVPSPQVRLENPDALLSRGDLAQLGLPRRAVDAVFGALPVVALPGYSRPFVKVADYRAFIAEHSYDGRTRVRPS
jgi:hypothetical protein